MNPASTLVLLGAGASRDAGLLLANELSEAIVKGAKESAENDVDIVVAQQLEQIYATMLEYEQAIAGAVEYPGVDVERLFSAIEMLGERRSLEIAPFVGAWVGAVQEMDPDTDPDNAVMQSYYTFEMHRLAIRRQLRRLLQPATGRLGYLGDLALWVGAGGTIATLNYDLAVEEAARLAGVEVDDSLDSLNANDLWSPNPKSVGLLKLHGSIDWHIQFRNKYPGFEFTVLERDPDPYGMGRGAPAIIFGTREKLRAEGPYLTMLRAFQEKLREAETLLVIGYSHRDEHINLISIVFSWIGRRSYARSVPGGQAWRLFARCGSKAELRKS